MKKFACFLLGMGIALQAHAAWDGISHHSRANCAGFNESVTWWWVHAIGARVESYHYPYGKFGNHEGWHAIRTPPALVWRHAAYHATESYDGTYAVVGYHYMYHHNTEVLVQSESVIDCNIYDGWWDR